MKKIIFIDSELLVYDESLATKLGVWAGDDYFIIFRPKKESELLIEVFEL